jgi:hypothetical protein
MAVEERRRAGLFDALAGVLGGEATNTVSEPLPPAGHDGATADDAERLGSALRTDMEALRIEMGLLRADVAVQNAELVATFRQELNHALLWSNRSMVIGLASTLLAVITLAAILARFVT